MHTSAYDKIQSTQEPITSYSNDNDSYMSRCTTTTNSSNKSSEESTTTLIISENSNQILNNSTSQYAEMEFPSSHPIAPPTNDVPVQYCVICEHLNTMVIYCTSYVYTQELSKSTLELIKPLLLKLVCIVTTSSYKICPSLLM